MEVELRWLRDGFGKYYTAVVWVKQHSLFYSLEQQDAGDIQSVALPRAIPSFAAANCGGHNGLLPPVMSPAPSLPPSLPSPLTTLPCLFPTSFVRPSLSVIVQTNSLLSDSDPLILSYCAPILPTTYFSMSTTQAWKQSAKDGTRITQ